MKLAMQARSQLSEILLARPSHKFGEGMMGVHLLGCGLEDRTFSDTSGDRGARFGSQRGEQAIGQAGAVKKAGDTRDDPVEIFADAGPVDVMSPGPDIERASSVPTRPWMKLSIRSPLEY